MFFGNDLDLRSAGLALVLQLAAFAAVFVGERHSREERAAAGIRSPVPDAVRTGAGLGAMVIALLAALILVSWLFGFVR